MKKEYEALSLDVVKFEAQDVITFSGPNQDYPNGRPPQEQEPWYSGPGDSEVAS